VAETDNSIFTREIRERVCRGDQMCYDPFMTTSSNAASVPPSAPRPVLIWRPESDETHIQPSLEQAAGFLEVPVAEVLAAIDAGDLLKGWFVDWQAVSAHPVGGNAK
jgi:hypothetical protein